MPYSSECVLVPRTSRLYIGRAPKDVEEAKDADAMFGVVIDIRVLTGDCQEAVMDGIPYDAEGAALGAKLYPFPISDERPGSPKLTGQTNIVKSAIDKIYNSVMIGKNVLIHTGATDLSRPVFLAAVYIATFTGCPLSQAMVVVSKPVGEIDVSEKLIGIGKSVLGEHRR